MRARLQSLLGLVLAAALGSVAVLPGLELAEPDGLSAVDRLAAPGHEHGHGHPHHLDALETEKEETEKADSDVVAAGPVFVFLHADRRVLGAITPQPAQSPHLIEIIAAHAPRGPPSA